jgi:hypothetical protein
MRNLAGSTEADDYIRRELERSRVSAVEVECGSGEVPYSVIGRLGAFVFTRGWSYWVVTGPVPLIVAEELHADPVGCTDIRAEGHCGCPPPAEWVSLIRPGGDSMASPESFITTYHIDSEVGLRVFVDTLRAHHLAPELVTAS